MLVLGEGGGGGGVTCSGLASHPEGSKNILVISPWELELELSASLMQASIHTYSLYLKIVSREKFLPNCNDFLTNIWSTSHSFGQ